MTSARNYRAATAALALICFALPDRLHPQASSARLEGTVTDPTGAAVVDATVTTTNVRTNSTLSTKTSAAGYYIFPSLAPAEYRLRVEAKGFRVGQVERLELTVSSSVTENVKLEVGAVTESVVVEANAVRVETTTNTIGRAITMRDIDTLPQLGRGPLALVAFAPGVSVSPGDTSFSRVNGMRQGSNNTKLDGIDVNDSVVPRLGLALTPTNTDSVGEFRIITNGAKAEYGRNAGGQVEMITRSGSNQFHGNLFDYLRNTVLNANQYFSNASGNKRPKFIQNIFGGSLGGPVIREKTFFFFNYQGTKTAQDVERNRTVLTADARNGIFRWNAGGAVQNFNIFQGGRALHPEVKKLLDISLLPNNTDIGDGLNTAGFRFNNPAGASNHQLTAKFDHNLTETHRLFFRYSRLDTNSIDSLNGAEARFPGRPQGSQGGIRSGYSVGSDWSFTPSMINELRVGHQQAAVAFLRPDRVTGPMLLPNLYTNPINDAFPQGRNSPVYDISDNATWVRGKSTWKFGATARRTLQYGYNDGGIYPNVSLTTGNANVVPASFGPQGLTSADRARFESLVNDLVGNVSSITQTFYSDLEKFQAAGTGRVRDFLFWDYGAYLQNDYKLRNNLVLNLGVRWELFKSPVEQNSLQGTVDKAAQINRSSRISDLTVQRRANWFDNDYNNFAPRVGFAWDPFSNGKTVLRGGYGTFFDRIVGATSSLVDGNTPGFSQATLTQSGLDFSPQTPYSTSMPAPRQPGAPILTQPLNRQTSIVVFQPNLPTGYVHHLNFGVQHEVTRNTVVDATWVRTRAVKLFTWTDVNQPRIYDGFLDAFNELERFRSSGVAPPASNPLVRMFGTPAAAVTAVGANALSQGLAGTAADTIDRTQFGRYAGAGLDQFFLRNYPQYNLVVYGSGDGRSWYDSLQLSLRRSTEFLKFDMNYTWSKSLDNISVDGNGFTAPIDNYNFRLNKARGDFDRPHVANWSVIYKLPIGRGRKFGGNMPGIANSLVGGWEIGTLGNWQSGSVFTVTSGRRTGPSTSNTWANYSGDRGIGSLNKTSGVVWFSPEQVAQLTFPAAGTIGTSGRNGFRGPGYFNIDLSLVKRFAMPWEGHFVNFRAEFYNLTNHANFANPGASVATPQTLGRISATVGSARIMQMALRYDF